MITAVLAFMLTTFTKHGPFGYGCYVFAFALLLAGIQHMNVGKHGDALVRVARDEERQRKRKKEAAGSEAPTPLLNSAASAPTPPCVTLPRADFMQVDAVPRIFVNGDCISVRKGFDEIVRGIEGRLATVQQ